MWNKTQIWYCDLPLFTWWERPSAHLRTRVTRYKGCTRKLLYHFGSAQVNVEFLMARTGKKWQVSSFQSLLASPQLLLKPTLPLQRTLLCIELPRIHLQLVSHAAWSTELLCGSQYIGLLSAVATSEVTCLLPRVFQAHDACPIRLQRIYTADPLLSYNIGHH